ncbi:nicotinate (nicotinamide) nucleotide adenylyltransferase [Alteromonas lipotrueiana]|uniref:nicotinate (nicotinamide) nucleotide adenylyltransferase n=1 Tax=Alteromonas lipotrueiana TaxID=2803815 RepID=UPI001C440C38|nr:nicotinate (nicotinamide) nucleotide adenylyltransferase [Alteromonas lipotrueiana]
MKTPVCVFGGTFNPPHLGHVRACLDAADEIGVTKVGLMPAKVPPHKQTHGVAEQHRVAMVNLTCNTSSRLYPELIELALPEPSYTVKTLQALRDKNPEAPLIFIMGEDSWLNLTSWYQWSRLTQFCHLVILKRATQNKALAAELAELAEQQGTQSFEPLHNELSGRIYFAQTCLQPVSSTQLREWLNTNANTPYVATVGDWVSDSVLHYIKENRLYV